MNFLKKYVIALTNLYGIVHKDKVLEIYHMQNEDPVTMKDIDGLLKDMPEDIKKAFIHGKGDYFVKEAVLSNKAFETLLGKKANKPYYVPKKEMLLKYVDEWYFEKGDAYYALFNHLKDRYPSKDSLALHDLCEDLYSRCQFGGSVQKAFDAFNDRKMGFEDIDQANETLRFVMDLSNSIRIWENNGHSPNEIFEKYEKPNLRPLPDQKYKTGRNDPCPCGSGKKYKKCCLN